MIHAIRAESAPTINVAYKNEQAATNVAPVTTPTPIPATPATTCTTEDMLLINSTKQFIKMPHAMLQATFRNKLSPTAKIYLFNIMMLGIRNKFFNNKTEVKMAAHEWARRIGVNSSSIYKLQSLLEEQGKISVERHKRADGLISRNAIQVELPDSINSDWSVSYNAKQVELVLQNKNITSTAKLLWLYCYMRSHNKYYASKKKTRAFTATLTELNQDLNSSQNSLFSSLMYLKQHGYISLTKTKALANDIDRKTKTVLKIEALQPEDDMKALKAEPNRSSPIEVISPDKAVAPANTGISKNQYTLQKSTYSSKKSTNLYSIYTYSTSTFKNNLNNLYPETEKNLYSATTTEPSATKSLSFFEKQQTLNEFSNRFNRSLEICQDVTLALRQTLMLFSKEFNQAECKEILAAKNPIQAVEQVLSKKTPETIATTEQDVTELVDAFCAPVKTNPAEHEQKLAAEIQNKLANITRCIPKAIRAKINNFAKCLKNKNINCDYLPQITATQLAQELAFHVATWQPTKITAKSEEHRMNVALVMAWNTALAGKWRKPFKCNELETLSVEHNSFVNKLQDYVPTGWCEHKDKVQKFLNMIGK